MRALHLFFLFALFVCSCNQKVDGRAENFDSSKLIVVDSLMSDTLKQNVQFISDRIFSAFYTPLEYSLFKGSVVVDSLVDSKFEMISWYHNAGDSIDLVAHVGQMETSALLLRFSPHDKEVYFYRASHQGQKYFKFSRLDSLSDQLEVSIRRVKLYLSGIPDTTGKKVIYGFVDMESADYFDGRDSIDSPYRVKMKFYFRSQFRKYNY